VSIIVSITFLALVWHGQQVKAPGLELQSVHATIASHPFLLEVANTPESRSKGLGGRQNLAAGKGMLFVFDTPDMVCFWMKDMNFDIDILWFDGRKNLIHELTDVKPTTYPQTFCPPVNAQYVVELPAGTASAQTLKLGDTLAVENR